jgi:hypothetical protein
MELNLALRRSLEAFMSRRMPSQSILARSRPRDLRPRPWTHSIPLPEVTEGDESAWDLWLEASRQLDAAFALTQPSDVTPLSAENPVRPGQDEKGEVRPRTVDELMVTARRNNRVCPRPSLWSQLYSTLGGGRHADLAPPPVERSIWTKLSDLQKRLRLRQQIEWAERHGKLEVVGKFIENLAEGDWLHMGDAEVGSHVPA